MYVDKEVVMVHDKFQDRLDLNREKAPMKSVDDYVVYITMSPIEE